MKRQACRLTAASERSIRSLARAYYARWGLGIACIDPEGVTGLTYRASDLASECYSPFCRLALREALRWGEPAVQAGPEMSVLWAVPLMHNAEVVGGLVSAVSEERLFAGDGATPTIDVRAACTDLREQAEKRNLTNAAYLELRRQEYAREGERAEAIHRFKSLQVASGYDLRAAYLLDEPTLVAAMRSGDRGGARAIINRMLVGMIQRAGDRQAMTKSFFMELVATMSRTAVEAGAAPEEVLGYSYQRIAELSAVAGEEELSRWLHDTLERLLDAIARSRRSPGSMLAGAMEFMKRHCCESISREQVAEVAMMSQSHFSRLFRREFKMSFVEVLSRMRAERAAELLAHSDEPLKAIATRCGFADQSYFGKVFRRWHHATPADFRRAARGQ